MLRFCIGLIARQISEPGDDEALHKPPPHRPFGTRMMPALACRLFASQVFTMNALAYSRVASFTVLPTSE